MSQYHSGLDMPEMYSSHVGASLAQPSAVHLLLT